VPLGDETEIALTAREKDALWPMMLATEFLFLEWFLDHPDEALFETHLAVLDWIYSHRAEICSRLRAAG